MQVSIFATLLENLHTLVSSCSSLQKTHARDVILRIQTRELYTSCITVIFHRMA